MGFSMNLCSYLPLNIAGMDPLLMEQTSGLQPPPDSKISQGLGGLFFEWETRPAGSSGGGRRRFQEGQESWARGWGTHFMFLILLV